MRRRAIRLKYTDRRAWHNASRRKKTQIKRFLRQVENLLEARAVRDLDRMLQQLAVYGSAQMPYQKARHV